MQRRLLISTLAVAVAAVLLLGLPLTFVLIRLQDRKSTRLNSSHPSISYAVFCLKTTTMMAPTPGTATVPWARCAAAAAAGGVVPGCGRGVASRPAERSSVFFF